MDLFSKAVNLFKKKQLNNETVTEKGHEAYNDNYVRSFLDQCVILNTKAVGSRPGAKNNTGGIERKEYEQYFERLYSILIECDEETYNTNICYMITLLFYFRDIQEGKGERDLFYWGYLWMYRKFPEIMLHMLDLLVYEETTLEVKVGKPFGTWKDLNKIMEYCTEDKNADIACDIYTQLEEKIVKLYSFQLMFDKKSKNPSLAAKWAPRENKYVDKKTNLVELIAADMFGDIDNPSHRIKLYRKTISSLNKKINTVEQLQCDNRWSEISFGNVPSKALKQYMKAFLYITKKGELRGSQEDRFECRKKFLEERHKAATNPSESVFNTKDLQPHEIVGSILKDSSEQNISNMTALWNKYISDLKEDFYDEEGKPKMPKTLAMCDVSGSMVGLPMDAAISTTILLIEMLGLNGNCVLTFESEPQWINLEDCPTLYSKIIKLKQAPWGGTTNFSSAFNLILSAAVDNKLPQEHMFERLVVLTDMQFDEADKPDFYYGCKSTKEYETFNSCYEKIKSAFIAANYKMPEIIFWNFRGNTNNHITETSQQGVTMLSGLSGTSMLKDFFLDEINLAATSIDKLQDNILHKSRHQCIYDTYIIVNNV